ncbi:MAG TPA: helix-turn-helix domain-containing protein [Pseudolabrys sp.]|nr:helix-turn-helix domain-containing protein [Pseudolabrys sp.]
MSELPPCIRNIGFDSDCYGCAAAERSDDHHGLSCRPRTLAARQHVFLQGDAQTHIYLVKAGAVRLYKVLANGRRQVIGFKFPGDFVALSQNAKYSFCAQAITGTELRSFPVASFQAFAGGDLRALTRLYDALSADLARAHDLVLTLGQRDAEGSVAAFLLDFDIRAAIRSAATDVLALPMPRADIADYLGITHETVSRIFTSFRKRGLIALTGLRGVRLLDREALRALAEGGDSSPAAATMGAPNVPSARPWLN